MEKNNVLAKLFGTVILLSIIAGSAAKPAQASTPVRFRQVQNVPIVQVMINGTATFDFIFDMGASSTVIDFELTKQLSLSPIKTTFVLTPAGSKTVSCYRLDNLALGSKSVRNLTVLSSELREIHAISPKIRGVLGQNFLSGFDYILNYRDQRIEFEEHGEFANTLQGSRLPVERDRGRVLIITQPSALEKRPSKLLMDSGASKVYVFKSASRDSGLEMELEVTGEIDVSTIVGSQTVSTGRLRRLQIGNERFLDLPVRVVNNRAAVEGRPENGLIPTSLFRSIYFNNTHNFVILNPRLSEHK